MLEAFLQHRFPEECWLRHGTRTAAAVGFALAAWLLGGYLFGKHMKVFCEFHLQIPFQLPLPQMPMPQAAEIPWRNALCITLKGSPDSDDARGGSSLSPLFCIP